MNIIQSIYHRIRDNPSLQIDLEGPSSFFADKIATLKGMYSAQFPLSSYRAIIISTASLPILAAVIYLVYRKVSMNNTEGKVLPLNPTKTLIFTKSTGPNVEYVSVSNEGLSCSPCIYHQRKGTERRITIFPSESSLSKNEKELAQYMCEKYFDLRPGSFWSQKSHIDAVLAASDKPKDTPKAPQYSCFFGTFASKDNNSPAFHYAYTTDYTCYLVDLTECTFYKRDPSEEEKWTLILNASNNIDEDDPLPKSSFSSLSSIIEDLKNRFEHYFDYFTKKDLSTKVTVESITRHVTDTGNSQTQQKEGPFPEILRSSLSFTIDSIEGLKSGQLLWIVSTKSEPYVKMVENLPVQFLSNRAKANPTIRQEIWDKFYKNYFVEDVNKYLEGVGLGTLVQFIVP